MKNKTAHTAQSMRESHRRTLVKSLLWRVIGVVWTWAGAYIIILLLPPSQNKAALAASAIVIYHHSTRLIMYYGYERIWSSIAWGTQCEPQQMPLREKLMWIVGVVVAVAVIVYLAAVLKKPI